MANNKIDLDYAYSYCKEIAISHYENFPVSSLLIPSGKRKYIYSIYAFARSADDIADSDKLTADEKIMKLDEYDNELSKIETNNTDELIIETENIFTALSNTIDEFDIPVQEFRNLLTAFAQDSGNHRYSEFDDLIEYSSFSANPVGHLVLYVFGYRPEENEQTFIYSDMVCTGLQLTNFWQDVSRDADMNRIYLPFKVMHDFGYSEQMLREKTENSDFRNMIKFLVDRTKVLFKEGNSITQNLNGRLKLEIKATVEGGQEILNKIEKIDYNVLSQRVKINNLDKIKLLGKTLLP